MIKKILFTDKKLIESNINSDNNKILKKKKKKLLKYIIRRRLRYNGYYRSRYNLLIKKNWYNQKKNIILYKNFFKKQEITLINDFSKNL